MAAAVLPTGDGLEVVHLLEAVLLQEAVHLLEAVLRPGDGLVAVQLVPGVHGVFHPHGRRGVVVVL